MRVFPIVNHSPGQLMSALIERHGDKFVPTIIPVGKRMHRDKNYRPVVFLLSADDMVRNLTATRKLDHDFYVFGSMSIFRYYNLTPIDVDGCLSLDAPPQRPRVVPTSNYIEDLVRVSRVGSLFDDLMTFIYKLPSKTHQRPVTNTCCLWLYEGGDMEKLFTMLRELPIKIKQATFLELQQIMSKDVVARIQLALKAYRAEPSLGLAQYSVLHKVQQFELSYVVGNVEKSDKLIDTYVANQGV